MTRPISSISAVPAVREANRRGVPINAWLTVPLGKGTFANEDNATEIRDAVKSFAAWSAEQKLRFGQVILDLEFPAGYQPLHDAIVDHDPTQLEQLMKGTIDPAHQCAAAAVYRDTIAWANQHGLRISGSPVLFALDDLGDGSVALQDALDMAPIPPAGYDSVYTQAYRAFGLDLGSGMVASYYRDAQRYFGARGQVSLGNVGLPPYTTITPLADDIRMLAGMGATEIPIFDFDSAVKAFGAAGIGDALDAAHHPMSGTELTAAQRMTPAGTAARGLFHTLDEFATTSTPILGGLQRPNPVPGGCTS